MTCMACKRFQGTGKENDLCSRGFGGREQGISDMKSICMHLLQAEKFEEAAKYEKELQSAQLDDEVSVLHANKKFYEPETHLAKAQLQTSCY